MFRSNILIYNFVGVLFFSCQSDPIVNCLDNNQNEINNIINNPLEDFDSDGVINEFDKCHYSNSLFSIDTNGCMNLDSVQTSRNLNREQLEFENVTLYCNTGVFIAYGQSNAANSCECNEETVSNQAYQYFQGETYRFNKTMIGTTGVNCSPWSVLATKLIDNNLYENVVFANCAVAGRPLEQLNKGFNYYYLEENLKNMILNFGKVDGILFHQGEANHSTVLGFDNYFNDFNIFQEKIKIISPETKIYLCRATYCNNYSDIDLIYIQNNIINSYDNVYAGPNTDELIDYRVDDCHLSKEGIVEFSNMFFELIKNPINIVINE